MKKIKDLNKYKDIVFKKKKKDIAFMDCKTQYNKDVNFPQVDLQV